MNAHPKIKGRRLQFPFIPGTKCLVSAYASVLDIPSEITAPFLKLVDFWMVSTGPKGLVIRLKSIKNDFIRSHAGMTLISSWVKKSKDKSTFVGPIKGLHTWSKRSIVAYEKALQLLNMYTMHFAPSLQSEQERKFLKGVTAPNTPVPIPISLGVLQSAGCLNRRKLQKPQSLVEASVTYYETGDIKREPNHAGKSFPRGKDTLHISLAAYKALYDYASRTGVEGSQDMLKLLEHVFRGICICPTIGMESYPTLERSEDQSNKKRLETTPDHYMKDGAAIQNFANTDYPITRFKSNGSLPLDIQIALLLHPKPIEPFYVGRIGFIQEPGFKLRAVANPLHIIQVALEPLKKALLEMMALLPWDCTADQAKAFPFIQEALKNGTTVHSVDLTDASSYFPLDLQRLVLDKLFPWDQESVNAFIFASKAPWLFKVETNKSIKTMDICWTKGQPLGLKPSFGSAFLVHGLLLLYLNDFKHDNSFYVLGDDVVILSDTLYLKYIKALEAMECPIAQEKSISSKILAEFAGKLITSDRIISILKWRNPSDDSFLDVIRNMGMKLIKLLRPRQQRVAKLLLDIPTDYGGLGFNPLGKPLADRHCAGWQLKQMAVEGSYLMSCNGLVNEFLFQGAHKPSGVFPIYWNGAIRDFDQKSLTYLFELLGRRDLMKFPLFPIYKALGRNLMSIEPTAPLLIEGGQNLPLTNLVSWERKLRYFKR